MEIGSNIKSEFSFFDKKIEIKHSEFYKVFAHLNNNSFAYTIFDLKNEEFLALESFIFNDEKDFIKIISQFPVFNWDLNSISFNYFNKNCTIIPNALYEDKYKKKYFEINNSIESTDEILINKLTHLNAITIYTIPKLQLSEISKLKTFQIKHSASIFIDNILKQTKNSNKSELFADVSTNNFDIVFIKKSKLIFYNNFKFKTINDFLYYILNCYNTLELNSNEITLRLSGEFNKEIILKNLKKYIKNVIIENKPKSYSYCHLFNNVPNHYFHKLYNQYKCE